MIALYLLGAVLVALVTAALLAPLFLHREEDVELEELPPAERLEAALEALQELAFEHETGKLPDEEYERMRSRYGRIALEAEEEVDAEAGGEDGAREPGGPCRGCGRDVPPDARFCPGCGRPVRRAEAADREAPASAADGEEGGAAGGGSGSGSGP